MKKSILKFGDIENKKQKFLQNKRPPSIKNIVFHKIVVSNKVSFGKKDFEYFDLYVFFSQICVPIEEILMKLNIYLF